MGVACASDCQMILLQTVVLHLQSKNFVTISESIGKSIEIVNNIFLFVLFYIVLGFIAERLAFTIGIYRLCLAKTTLKY